MDLSLTPEQTLLRNAARDFLSHECPLIQFIRPLDESETGFSPELWRKMAELGWVGLILPTEYGGGGGSHTDAGVLFEELGYHCVYSPLLSSVYLAGTAILEAGTPEQKAQILPSVASGDRILAFAYTEPDYGWNPTYVQLEATPSEGGYTLNGTKLFVHDAQIADQILVVARTGRWTETDLTMFLVDRNAPGVSVHTLTGWTADKLNEVTFDKVQAPAASIIGPVNGAWAPLQRALDRAAIMLCAYSVGGMQKVFEMTNDYSQRRIHFGVPISTFQRIQDYVIDIINQADAARWTTYEALWKLDNGYSDAPEAVSIAKAVASEGYTRSAQDAHHVHAGTGGDKNYGLYLYTKKAKTYHSYLGDSRYHKLRVGRALNV